MIELEAPSPAAPVETVTPIKPSEVRPKTPREVGEHAARIIEERGWARVAYRDDDGSVCIVQAIYDAGGTGPSDPDGAYNAIRYGQLNGRSLSGWNDDRGRTKAEVLAALRSIR
jgi:hypothetical protein